MSDKSLVYESNLDYYEKRDKEKYVEAKIMNVFMNQTAHVKFSVKMWVPDDLDDYSKYNAIEFLITHGND